ncbi:MAG: hypothetical protein ABII12_03210 [Planctomycetota bacterium]
MDEAETVMRYALLLAAHGGRDLGPGAESPAMQSLMGAGLLDGDRRITELGVLVAEETIQAAARSEHWLVNHERRG